MSSLNRLGIRSIVVQTISLIIGLAILFMSAGTLHWIRGWIYVGLVSMYWVISTVVLARVNPEMLNARGSVVKEGTKGFERVWVVIYPTLTFINLVVMGFDAIRFQWSFMPFWLAILGIVILIPACVIGAWAMAVNKFFEWTARIQVDRQQYICTSGPYKIMRHPGYAGAIVSLLAYPFILGSWWGFVLTGISTIIIVIRTAQEDSMLQNELPGYKEYTNQVKYRLIPLIW
jgi:protein-S-isoprenylcysteine O-methyltransferase Ste14